MFSCEQCLNLFEYYDGLAGDIQSLLLNNMSKSGNMNMLTFVLNMFGIFFVSCPLLKIPCILTFVAICGFFSHSRFLGLPSLLVYSPLTVTEMVIISKIILFALARLWPEIVCKAAWENKTVVMGSAYCKEL